MLCAGSAAFRPTVCLFGRRRFAILPPPVAHLGQVDAVVADVLAVLDELILHLLHEVGAAVAELRQAADRVDDEVKRSMSFKTRISKGVVMVPSSL